jgi:type II secretory pathway component PulM
MKKQESEVSRLRRELREERARAARAQRRYDDLQFRLNKLGTPIAGNPADPYLHGAINTATRLDCVVVARVEKGGEDLQVVRYYAVVE